MSAATRFSNDLRYRSGTHPDQTQLTPDYVLDAVRSDLGGVIGLDPCTTADNPTGAESFYTAEQDGLVCVWAMYPSVFVNPPYGKAREPWVRRCISAGERGQKVILLMPAATDTRIFRSAASTATAIVYVTGRVKFGTLRPNRRQHAASHPSALIGWGTSLDACITLGWRARPWPSE
jgi:phage N-6-adenine-methyltransferase